MTGFKYFHRVIKEKGGIWNSDDVYFSQTRDTYQAAYLPKYPEKSYYDQTISINHVKGRSK